LRLGELEMEYTPPGNNGLIVSWLAFGAMAFGSEPSGACRREARKACLAAACISADQGSKSAAQLGTTFRRVPIGRHSSFVTIPPNQEPDSS
jgi:hypothetical protein